jgi:beta-lactam-binding protein with PASTA domain
MQGSIDTPQETVIVPNVKGVTLEIAAKSLQAVGLQAWFQGSSDLSAIVTRQVPQAGLELPVGGEVILLADSTVKTTLNVIGTESRGQTPSVPPQPGILTEGVSAPIGTTTVTSSNIATNVSVTPSQTTWQTSKVLAYPASASEGKSTIFYQPPQRPISHYFVANTKPRFYPAWYPKRFLTVVSPQGAASTQQAEGMTITAQPQAVDQTKSQFNLAWYPKVFVSQEGVQESGVLSQSDRQVGVFAVSTTPAVPVPNLLRLRQEDAAAAIKKAGLAVGNISRMQSSQVRPGLVLQQIPRARAIVPAGTEVQLWIAE